MSLNLKPLNQQVLFITGATSGIGLAIVKIAVKQGAKVFMVARNEDELQVIQNELRNKNYESAYAVADVAEMDQLQVAADNCLITFGRIDTWINNAGITIYSKLLETSEDEAKKLFDTNFWGVVNGCRVAAPILREHGGALINIGSVLSRVSIPLQGLYSASKHAVKAYTDTLRRELMSEKSPISVSLVMPGAIDTPYPLHGRSHIGEPVHTPPVYAPEVAAKAILKCAIIPTRDIGVGSSAFIYPFMDRMFPGIQDKIMARAFMENAQSFDKEHSYREQGNDGILFAPAMNERETRGNYPGHVMKSSVATEISSALTRLTKGNVSSFLSGGAAFGSAILFLKKKRII